MTCSSGKVSHSSREEALRFLHRRHPKSHRVGSERRLRPYLCPECSAWHLGNGPRIYPPPRFSRGAP